jgi:polysaccharide biosynthesis/export protein
MISRRALLTTVVLVGLARGLQAGWPQPPKFPANTSSRQAEVPVAAAVSATPAPEALAPFTPADPNKILGNGDQVSLEIVEDREPPRTMRVTDTGELDVFPIGRVRVAGKTSAAAQAEIKRRLEADYYYKATVRLGIDQVNRAQSSGRIYLSGLVRAAGPQEIPIGETLTVSAAIIKAGGFAQFADDRKVKITRKGKGGTENFVVDVKAVLEKGKIDLDRELRDGDYVHVPQRLINW